MSALKDIVRKRLAELDRDPFEAARKGGLNKHFIHDLLIEKKQGVGAQNFSRLAKALDWDTPTLTRHMTGQRSQGPALVDAHGEALHLPKNGIREIASQAGLGGGQTVPSAYARQEEGWDVVDAFKPDAWLLPPSFVRNAFAAPVANIIAISTQGESMSPTINHGDVVFVDTSHQKISPPGLYALRDVYGEIIVKRLDIYRKGDSFMVSICSDNPHEPRRDEVAEEVSLVGRVCGIMKVV